MANRSEFARKVEVQQWAAVEKQSWINYTSYFERFILHYFNYQYARWLQRTRFTAEEIKLGNATSPSASRDRRESGGWRHAIRRKSEILVSTFDADTLKNAHIARRECFPQDMSSELKLHGVARVVRARDALSRDSKRYFYAVSRISGAFLRELSPHSLGKTTLTYSVSIPRRKSERFQDRFVRSEVKSKSSRAVALNFNFNSRTRSLTFLSLYRQNGIFGKRRQLPLSFSLPVVCNFINLFSPNRHERARSMHFARIYRFSAPVASKIH